MIRKEKVHEQCRQMLDGRIAMLRQRLEELSEAVSQETKSTAGDKYETARAMLHIEQDQARQQLAVVSSSP